jgi:hypothetical protein
MLGRFFDQPANQGHSRTHAYRYGMLVVIFALLVANLWIFSHRTRHYTGDPYLGFVAPLMLLFNHVAFTFPWRGSLRISLQIIAWCWVVFGLFYILYWSRVLFPLVPR